MHSTASASLDSIQDSPQRPPTFSWLCTQVIDEYPSHPDPEIFGLHKNAEITGSENETYELFATVLSMQPRQVRPQRSALCSVWHQSSKGLT